MQILKHGTEKSSNKCHINSYSDLYVEPSPIIIYLKPPNSITKERVFPNRYTDKHIWNIYGYKTNYNTSFNDNNNCLYKNIGQKKYLFQ